METRKTHTVTQALDSGLLHQVNSLDILLKMSNSVNASKGMITKCKVVVQITFKPFILFLSNLQWKGAEMRYNLLLTFPTNSTGWQ